MITARDRSAEPTYLPSHWPRQNPDPVKEPSRRSRGRLPCFVLLVSVFLLCLALIYVNALTVSVGYQAEALRMQLTDLEQERQYLRSGLERVASLERVERVAVSELGMVRPTREDVIYVAVDLDRFNKQLVPEEGVVQAEQNANGAESLQVQVRENAVVQAFLDFVVR